MNKLFRFKQFNLHQEKSAQRMSTDSMLLGALAFQEEAMNILDIGTGTGVLALMMAQKHPDALVDAVEPDPDSAVEAKRNFEESDWSYRLTCYPQRIQDFVKDETLHYDLILSNPPYFPSIRTEKGGNTQWPDERRRNARTADSLSFSDLFEAVSRVLVSYGHFYLIIPASAEEEVQLLARDRELFCNRRVALKHRQNSETERIVLAYSKTREEIMEETVVLYEDNGDWTEDYMRLTREFHSGL